MPEHAHCPVKGCAMGWTYGENRLCGDHSGDDDSLAAAAASLGIDLAAPAGRFDLPELEISDTR
jgi:hypothetical protein